VICHVYRRGGLFWGKLRLDHETRVDRFPLGTSDRRVAQSKLLEIAKEREKVASGMLPPDSVREAAAKPLSELLVAFLEDLQARGRSPGTVAKYRSNLQTCFAACHWSTLQKLTARSFCEWRARCGLSPKTLNDVLGVLSSFLGWLVHQRLAVENPLSHVQRIDTRGTGGQFRRSFSATELATFLSVAPAERRTVYLAAVYTGLRRCELQALRWSDVILDAASPVIRVRASITKNRKDAVLPLHPALVEALASHRPENVAPFTPVFSFIPRVTTLRRDLLAARIPFMDELGRRADFHSLRMTFGTNLTLSGAAPRVVMELMRHSDIKLTMKIYTDAGKLPLVAAVAALAAHTLGGTGSIKEVS